MPIRLLYPVPITGFSGEAPTRRNRPGGVSLARRRSAASPRRSPMPAPVRLVCALTAAALVAPLPAALPAAAAPAQPVCAGTGGAGAGLVRLSALDLRAPRVAPAAGAGPRLPPTPPGGGRGPPPAGPRRGGPA